MKYVERFLRYIFWVAVTATIAWVAKKLFDHATRPAMRNTKASADAQRKAAEAKTLFRDPVCGTYVAEDISHCLNSGSENLHFCSRECKERYQRDFHAEDHQTHHAAAGA